MESILNYLQTGGYLMIPIIIVAFMIWYRYFISLAALKHSDATQLVGHEIRFMAALVAAAPMLGLLGTVIGMMDTFHATAMQSTAADSTVLANGIGKALVTTQAGLAAAIPGSLAIAHLRHLLKNHHA